MAGTGTRRINNSIIEVSNDFPIPTQQQRFVRARTEIRTGRSPRGDEAAVLRRVTVGGRVRCWAVVWMVLLWWTTVLGIGLCASPAAGAPYDMTILQRAIKAKISAFEPKEPLTGANGRRELTLPLWEIYTSRDGQPLWMDGQGKKLPRVDEFLKVLEGVSDEGLRPSDYGLDRLRSWWLQPPPTAEEAADLDILTSRTFLALGSDLAWGRFDPEREFFQWRPYRRTADTVGALREVAAGGGVAKALTGVAPRHPSYLLLREEGKRYRLLVAAGGWKPLPPLPPKTKLRYGVVSPV
ncbi:MAG: hypothetical protein N2Z74_09950, partial [Syntrophales bacterium]|nr:hypothetical protein [Syntrophales bacterium]